MSDWAWLGLSLGALTGGTLLSILVQSLRDLSRSTLEDIVALRANPAAAARISRILNDLEGHAAATALPRTAFNLVVAIGLIFWIAALRTGGTPQWGDAFVGCAVATILLWLFTAVLPTSIARHAGELTVYSWSPMLRVFYVVGMPLRSIASLLDEAIRRLSGKNHQTQAQERQDEILSVVEEAREEGQFDDTERDMIEAVVKFRDKTVGQVMTPRTEIKAIDAGCTLSEVTASIRRVGHSRIPVYEGSVDRIIGVFYVKDLMRWLAGEGSRGGKAFKLANVVRPAYFVPQTKTVRELLAELLNKRVHIAMVADEYGGTAGLVTIEDIIEEVFGNIQDEYEVPESEAVEVKLHVASRTAEIDGRTYIADANDELAPLNVEIPESDDYDTVGGFVTVTLGRIPKAGETFDADRLRVTILSAEATRVTRIRVEPLSEETKAAEQAQAQAQAQAAVREE